MFIILELIISFLNNEFIHWISKFNLTESKKIIIIHLIICQLSIKYDKIVINMINNEFNQDSIKNIT